MKKIVHFMLFISIIFLFMTIPSIAKAKPSTVWKTWPAKTEVDVDKEWVITFSKEMDWRSLFNNIYVIRERDNKKMITEPYLLGNKKSVELHLGELYGFGETYTLYIKDVKTTSGIPIKEPIIMKFQTVNPEFKVEEINVRDGLRFEARANSKELKSGEKLYVKIKVTNVSDEAIPYWGRDGCDKGFSANLYRAGEEVKYESANKWKTALGCTMALEQYNLQPGETLEGLEVLYPPTTSLDENYYVKVLFQKGEMESTSTIVPIEIPIDIE